jgi:hypothetical protein
MVLLYHFSEDPSITRFNLRFHPSHPDQPAMVWAIDEDRSPLYYFPRDCPRIGFWARSDSTAEDIHHFLAHTKARKVIAVEGRWLEKLQNTKLYVYQLPDEPFTCFDQGAGYYTSHETVDPLSVEPVGHLIQRLVEAKVELRLTPSLLPLRDTLISSTLHFSMIRMRNATQELD